VFFICLILNCEILNLNALCSSLCCQKSAVNCTFLILLLIIYFNF
jgi:hypothetical protein